MGRGICILLSTLALSACNYRYEKFKFSDERMAGEAWYPWVDRTVLQPRCARCHRGAHPSGNIDLATFAGVAKSRVVVPKNPEQSALYESVLLGRMPKDGALPVVQIERLKQWILAGAPGDSDIPIETPPPKPEPKYAWLQKNLFGPRCVKCHSGDQAKRDVDLSSYSLLVSSEGLTMKPLDPGHPENSGVCEQIDSETMPPDPDKISQNVRVALAEWIRKGAPED